VASRSESGVMRPAAVATGLGAVLAGVVVASNPYPLLVVLAVGVFVLFARGKHRGVVAGLVAVAGVNGFPLFAIGSSATISGLRSTDVAAAGFCVLWIVWAAQDRSEHSDYSTRVNSSRAVGLAIVVFATLWVAQVIRSWVFESIPLISAILYMRTLVGIAPAFLAVRHLRTVEDRRELSTVIILFASVYAVAYLVSSVTGADMSSFTHANRIDNAGSMVRLYAEGTQLLNLAACIGVYAVLAESSRRSRPIRLVTGVLFVLAVLAQQGRSNIVSLVIGLIIVFLMDKSRGRDSELLSRNVLNAAIAALIVVAVVITAGPSIRGLIDVTRARATSAVIEITSLSGNFGYRVGILSILIEMLLRNPLLGVGFLHPEVHYVAGLPGGSIVNSDLGGVGILITMGALGALAYYSAPVILARIARLQLEVLSVEERGVLAYLIAAVLAAPLLLPAPVFSGALIGWLCSGMRADRPTSAILDL